MSHESVRAGGDRMVAPIGLHANDRRVKWIGMHCPIQEYQRDGVNAQTRSLGLPRDRGPLVTACVQSGEDPMANKQHAPQCASYTILVPRTGSLALTQHFGIGKGNEREIKGGENTQN